MEAPLSQPPRFTTPIRVRYAETDAAGVVYYGNYLTYFEVVRVELLRALGHPITAIEERGVMTIGVCHSIACEQCTCSSTKLLERARERLGIAAGETSDDGRFTLEWANCMGMCDQGPALLVNDRIHTHVTPEKVHEILEECRRIFGVHAAEAKEVVFR